MSGSSNFLQFNPGATNQESDSTYNTDTTRTGGIVVNQTLSSALLNKVFFQASTFVAAFAQMMATKGYAMSDASISTLESILANVITNADGPPAVPATVYLTSIFPTINLSAASNQTACVNAASANGVVNLPSSPSNGQIITVKRSDSSGNTLSIQPGSNTIDGNSSQAVGALASYMLQFTTLTSNWNIIASH